jgi:hydroxypyruvate isomerase
MGTSLNRRLFIKRSLSAGIALAAFNHVSGKPFFTGNEMKFGLVTYQWGQDWDLPTLITNCEKAGYPGVELRAEHAHKVEINLTQLQRSEVRKRFAGSSVECIGYGSNFEFHSPDPQELRRNIEQAKEYIKLCSDIGASGIKVKPNDLPDGVPKEKTLFQISTSLNELGKFARNYGQRVRVEVHGNHTQELPNMKTIFDNVTEDNVRICWNCNEQDLLPPGLEGNFNMVRRWIGDTVHVRELNDINYPYQQLVDLLAGMNYKSWVLLEGRTEPADRVSAMREQLSLFNQMVKNAERNK